jgi:hypothetical protein
VVRVPEQTARVQASEHITGLRWFQRSDDPVMAPEDAWADATTIHGHGLEGDEVRYHEHTETVLVRKNDTLVTVIDAPTAKWTVRQAVQQFGRDQA